MVKKLYQILPFSAMVPVIHFSLACYDTFMFPERIQNHRHLPAYLTAVLLVVAVGLFIFASLYQPKKTAPTARNTTPIVRVVATPVEFQDFVGTISAVGTDLSVKVNITQLDGSKQEKVYTVGANASTTVQVLKRVNDVAAYQPLTWDDLRSGQLVHIYADRNIAALSSFIATKIDRLDI